MKVKHFRFLSYGKFWSLLPLGPFKLHEAPSHQRIASVHYFP